MIAMLTEPAKEHNTGIIHPLVKAYTAAYAGKYAQLDPSSAPPEGSDRRTFSLPSLTADAYAIEETVKKATADECGIFETSIVAGHGTHGKAREARIKTFEDDYSAAISQYSDRAPDVAETAAMIYLKKQHQRELDALDEEYLTEHGLSVDADTRVYSAASHTAIDLARMIFSLFGE
jgi:hypothetical protein